MVEKQSPTEDSQYFIFEFPKNFEEENLEHIKHNKLRIEKEQILGMCFDQLEESSKYPKNKILGFESKGKVQFKEVKNFMKVMNVTESAQPSYKNIIVKNRRKKNK
mmetsp:Transcript_2906/g.2983  ORF Transcript_2906/g.2983 Transcript_2906/m.2983 type:complete len:106 (-) Transcript_2906:967-1284(-)